MTKVIFEENTYVIGAWTLPYLINGDASDLTNAERAMIDEFMEEATATWSDADGQRWVFSHEAVDTDSYNEFGHDDITDLPGPVWKVSFLFKKKEEDKPDWRDPNSGCYCVVCLAPVREDIFVQRGGCCPNHKFDDECTYR